MVARKETRHGATQPEDSRERDQLLLRLTPKMIATIRKRAAAKGKTISGYIEDLVVLDGVRTAAAIPPTSSPTDKT